MVWRQLAWPLGALALAASSAGAVRGQPSASQPGASQPGAPQPGASQPGAPQPSTEASPPRRGTNAQRRVYRVAAIGDSLTDPKSGGGGYLRRLAEWCPESRFDSFGRGGEMVNQMRRRFERDVLSGGGGAPAYTHVIVFGGVNDLYSDETAGRTVPKIERDLGWMYQRAKNAGLAVVAITVAPWGGFRRYATPHRMETTLELNRWILESPAKGRADSAVDAYPLLSCGSSTELCPSYAAPFKDGLHFGPEGHLRLGKALFTAAFSDCR